MQNLTVDQILERLNPHFHDDFLNKTSKIIRPDEKFWGVGNWSLIQGGERLGKYVGYVLITSYRVLEISFQPERGLFAQKRETIKLKSLNHSAYKDLDFPLNEKEVGSRYLWEQPLRNIENLHKDDEIGNFNGSNIDIISISYNLRSPLYFTDIEQANELYGLLTDIVHGSPIQIVQVPNLAEQLEKLTDLHRYQVITDEEFEAAKKRLGL